MMRKFAFLLVTAIAATFQGCGPLANLPLSDLSLPTAQLPPLPSQPKLSQEEAGSGLKEALIKGVGSGTEKLQQTGGFSQNAQYKILLTPEIQSLESKIRGNSLLNAAIGKELDKAIAAMNQGAEMATAKAMPIFKNAVQQMSFRDALNILTGGNGAATQYLKSNTTTELTAAFQPEIKTALETVSIYQYWTPIVNTINRNKKVLGITQDVQPNLESYVTEKTLFALFAEIETQENLIRKDPVQRSSDLLKRVFDYADNKQNSSNP